jgi:hypothetical protein
VLHSGYGTCQRNVKQTNGVEIRVQKLGIHMSVAGSIDSYLHRRSVFVLQLLPQRRPIRSWVRNVALRELVPSNTTSIPRDDKRQVSLQSSS